MNKWDRGIQGVGVGDGRQGCRKKTGKGKDDKRKRVAKRS